MDRRQAAGRRGFRSQVHVWRALLVDFTLVEAHGHALPATSRNIHGPNLPPQVGAWSAPPLHFLAYLGPVSVFGQVNVFGCQHNGMRVIVPPQ